MQLFRNKSAVLDRRWYKADLLGAFRDRGLQPAGIGELLAFGTQNSFAEFPCDILALGTVWEDEDEHRVYYEGGQDYLSVGYLYALAPTLGTTLCHRRALFPSECDRRTNQWVQPFYFHPHKAIEFLMMPLK